ncbi:MAG: hypothetical protein BK997_03405 [Candidatus Micrarchaeum sp. ARMAN-1]|nr:MAG: hypothetical protein BK997_03405 [Candidatus Micrarchaeum sp. ARMAN-1]
MHHKNIAGKKKYVFRKANHIYKSAFVEEKRRISKSVSIADAAIEHVGSTAVPELGGKNVLDILVGLKRGRRDMLKEKLQSLGYDFMPGSGSPHRLFFIKDILYKRKRMRIHLHLVKFDGREWKQKTAFRDYLTRHKDAVRDYEAVKKKAVKMANGDKDTYMRVKNGFIRRITREALRTRK